MKAKSALQSLRQGIVICDAKGCVVYVNAAYAEFTGIRPEEIRGKKITGRAREVAGAQGAAHGRSDRGRV